MTRGPLKRVGTWLSGGAGTLASVGVSVVYCLLIRPTSDGSKVVLTHESLRLVLSQIDLDVCRALEETMAWKTIQNT